MNFGMIGTLSGINIILGESLPNSTMMVSKDIYDSLKKDLCPSCKGHGVKKDSLGRYKGHCETCKGKGSIK